MAQVGTFLACWQGLMNFRAPCAADSRRGALLYQKPCAHGPAVVKCSWVVHLNLCSTAGQLQALQQVPWEV